MNELTPDYLPGSEEEAWRDEPEYERDHWWRDKDANPVTIKKTVWGYSMYDTPYMTASNLRDGLIASCDKLADQIDFAARMGWPYVVEEETA